MVPWFKIITNDLLSTKISYFYGEGLKLVYNPFLLENVIHPVCVFLLCLIQETLTMTPGQEWSCVIAIMLHYLFLTSDCRTWEWGNPTRFTCELWPWANASFKRGALPGRGAILSASSWPGPCAAEVNRWQSFEVHCHKTWHDCVSLQFCHDKHEGIWEAFIWEETCQDWRGREIMAIGNNLSYSVYKFNGYYVKLED